MILRINTSKAAEVLTVILIASILSSILYFGRDANFPHIHPLIPIKAFHISALAVISTVGLLFLSRGQTDWRQARYFLAFFALYGALHLAFAPYLITGIASTDEILQRVLELRINVIVLCICFVVILAKVRDPAFMIWPARIVVAATVLINIVCIFFPEVWPLGITSQKGRAAGLFMDPNQCATILAFAIPLVCMGLNRPLRLITYAIILFGILLTFSREGMLLGVIAASYDYLNTNSARRFDPMKLLTGLGMAVLFGFGVTFAAHLLNIDLVEFMKPYLTDDTLKRMSGSDSGSSLERTMLMGKGLEMFDQSPLFGAGFGATRVWDYYISVHNMYLLMLSEFGLLGLGTYGIFLFGVYKIRARLGPLLLILVATSSVFSHSWFDIPYYGLIILIYWRLGLLIEPATLKRRLRSRAMANGSVAATDANHDGSTASRPLGLDPSMLKSSPRPAYQGREPSPRSSRHQNTLSFSHASRRKDTLEPPASPGHAVEAAKGLQRAEGAIDKSGEGLAAHIQSSTAEMARMEAIKAKSGLDPDIVPTHTAKHGKVKSGLNPSTPKPASKLEASLAPSPRVRQKPVSGSKPKTHQKSAPKSPGALSSSKASKVTQSI